MIHLLAPKKLGKKLNKFKPVLYNHLKDRVYSAFWNVIVVENPQDAQIALEFSKFGTLVVNTGNTHLKNVLNCHVDDLILSIGFLEKILEERKRVDAIEKEERLLMEPIMLNPKMAKAYRELAKCSISRSSLVIAEDGLLEEWILWPILGNHEVVDFGVISEEEALLRIFGTKNHSPLLSKEGVLVLMNCDNCSEQTISKVARCSSLGMFTPYLSNSKESCVSRTLFHFVNEKNVPEMLLQIVGTSRSTIPPVREIADSLPNILRLFISTIAQKMFSANVKISQDMLSRIKKTKWSGNWREFFEFCKLIAIGEEKIQHQLDEKKEIPKLKEYTKMILAESERDLIKHAIQIHGMDRKKLCEVLGINQKTLVKKLKLYGLDGKT